MKISPSCALILVLASPGVLTGQNLQAFLKNQTIVAERKDDTTGTGTAIVVDRDDAVRQIDFQGPDARAEVGANLGARVPRSGSVDLVKVLPRDKVATAARRVTLRNGDVIHVVIAWGLSSYEKAFNAYCGLYVYRQRRGEVEEIFSEELGEYMDQFIVEDLNRDGNVEVLVATGENAVRVMYIWQIHPDGRFTELQQIDGYEVHTLADRFMGPDIGIFVANKSEKRLGCYDTAEYVWSSKKKKYVVSR